MRFVEHLNTAFLHQLCAVFLLSGEVGFISLFRMVGDDSPVGRLFDFVPVDFRNMWVVFGLRHGLAHRLPVDFHRVLPD